MAPAARALRVALVALAIGGCDSTDPKGWLVDRTRLLGARIEAASEPARAALAVGESATLTWLLASPTPAPSVSWTYAACAPPSGDLPTPRCEGAVLATGAGSGALPFAAMPITVPGVSGDALFVLAAFCNGGAPVLDAAAFTATCPGGTALLGSTTIPLGSANQNPPVGDADVTLDGAVLPPSTEGPVDAACAGTAAAPVVLAGAHRTFGFRFHDEQRETVGTGREALVLSHVITAGELDRQYSAFDPDEASPKDVTVPWDAPGVSAVPVAGRIVELYFVLRDGRGGTTFARRTVCARRP